MLEINAAQILLRRSLSRKRVAATSGGTSRFKTM